MSLLLDDVRAYLLSGGVPKVYEGYMPDEQDSLVAVFETGGYPRDTLDGNTETVTFQLRVRGAKLDYFNAHASWLTCFNLLQDSQATGSLLPGVVFIQALHYGPLAWNDENGRPNFTSNFRCMRYR